MTARGGSRREARLQVRLTAEEHARVMARAARAGLTASEYVRRRALSEAGGPRVEVDAERLRLAYRDLRHAGGNLNQVAHRLNMGKDPGTDIGDVLARVGAAAESVAAALAAARNGV